MNRLIRIIRREHRIAGVTIFVEGVLLAILACFSFFSPHGELTLPLIIVMSIVVLSMVLGVYAVLAKE